MSRLLKDEKTGGVLGHQVDETRMMHKMFGEMAQMSLAAANLPSRTDFEALDERIGRIEDGRSAVQAELAQLRVALVSARDRACRGYHRTLRQQVLLYIKYNQRLPLVEQFASEN